ncbi:MAG: PleD family two-component system response regulator [Pseudomonadota bacterium]
MTARVLVVDDIPANVKLLEARLSAEYFDVLTAFGGEDALNILARERVDVVLLDVMMPGIDGFEVCRRMKADPKTHHIPVIMVTALDQPSDKLQGLQNGADDFLTKPVDDIALVTRVKNLARLKTLNDEMLMRASTGRDMGVDENTALERALSGISGRILIVDDHERSRTRLYRALAEHHEAEVLTNPDEAVQLLTREQRYDVVLVSLNMDTVDGLRLCSQIRSLEASRHLPIIMLVEHGNEARLLRGLDMGVNDYIMRPVEQHELLARVRTQIKRKRHADYLRDCLEHTVELALTDALTGLHNRHYMQTHLQTLVADGLAKDRELSVLIADIDHFKSVNDTYGHDVGDLVLREFSNRLKKNTRGADLACRLGGEEFVLIMPDTPMSRAYQTGERLRTLIASEPFAIGNGESIRVTASIGLATLEYCDDTPERLIKRADVGLYSAKKSGRNRVVSQAAKSH